MIKVLINFFNRSAEETINEVPARACPNCWGQQEFDKSVRDLRRDKQIDVNNHEANYAFIQDFVVNKVEGITIQKRANGQVCPTCHINYD